jgi:hypothetical protein
MLTLHNIEAPQADITARAVQTLVTALDDPNRAAAVAAAEVHVAGEAEEPHHRTKAWPLHGTWAEPTLEANSFVSHFPHA